MTKDVSVAHPAPLVRPLVEIPHTAGAEMGQTVAQGFQVFTAQDVFPAVDVGATSHDREFHQGEQKANITLGGNPLPFRTAHAHPSSAVARRIKEEIVALTQEQIEAMLHLLACRRKNLGL
jgi:hypothetical protein